MAQFQMNDTIALMMRILNNHQEILRLWHEVSNLLVRLGLVTPAAAVPTRATHVFDVRWMQENLNKHTGANLVIDGVIGPRTIEAVRNYQGLRGLVQDGWPGPLTLARLEQDMIGP